jgi:hypothetical protein
VPITSPSLVETLTLLRRCAASVGEGTHRYTRPAHRRAVGDGIRAIQPAQRYLAVDNLERRSTRLRFAGTGIHPGLKHQRRRVLL